MLTLRYTMLLVSRSPIADMPDFESLYHDHFDALTQLGVERFALPSEVAEQLAHEVLLAALHQLPRMPDARTWLMAAMTSACSQASKGGR